MLLNKTPKPKPVLIPLESEHLVCSNYKSVIRCEFMKAGQPIALSIDVITEKGKNSGQEDWVLNLPEK